MGMSNKVKCISERTVTENETDQFWYEGDGNSGVSVDENGVAYTFFTAIPGKIHPDDEEIQHVQDFFAGKYCGDGGYCSACKLYGAMPGTSFGNWSK